ncbi:hypothetical protein [Deinococcus ficus]|uniref:Uncharacterized protein n=1 Tax=Deinococcus ficus TaxID=317577 RepID=A0A221T2W5_9DEIO|nr:hypothetical protein [Deinococcus ficus]ASN83248.1 hypothetical protein DFI_18800 [Deinococcus ficus]
MLRALLTSVLLTSAAAAQTIPNMNPATPEQQKAINQNALAFTGRTCTMYGVKLVEVPASVPAEKLKKGMLLATDTLLNAYTRHGTTPTRVQRTDDGGAVIYTKWNNGFMQLAVSTNGTRRFHGMFACILR